MDLVLGYACLFNFKFMLFETVKFSLIFKIRPSFSYTHFNILYFYENKNLVMVN